MRVMRVMRVLAAIAMVTLLAACGSSSGSSGSNALGGSGAKNAAAVVELKNNAFNPPTVTIRSGQTVLWEFNDGGIVHNVTGDGYRSKDMGSGFVRITMGTSAEMRRLLKIIRKEWKLAARSRITSK